MQEEGGWRGTARPCVCKKRARELEGDIVRNRIPLYTVTPTETHYTYTPSDARAARALCCDDVNAERALWVRGVHEGPWSALGVHVAHFCPMCLTARNSLRRLTSPIMPRTGPTRFDVRSSPGGRAEWALGEHPHAPGGRVAAWLGAGDRTGRDRAGWGGL